MLSTLTFSYLHSTHRLKSPISLWKQSIPMIDTSAKNFNFNLNLNIKIIRIRYQYQYQYCRTHNSISISIPIPKTIKFKLNLKTIPRYLDILQSQANTQKIQASIAQLWFIRLFFWTFFCNNLQLRVGENVSFLKIPWVFCKISWGFFL